MTLEEQMDSRMTTCATCNNSGIGDPRDWHHYRHSYRGTWQPLSSPQTPATSGVGTPLRVPFDPVLRLALIRKGVITPDDLKAAEEEIKVTSQLFESMTLTGDDGREVSHDLPRRTGGSAFDGE